MKKFLSIGLFVAAFAISGSAAIRCLSCDSEVEPSCGYSHNDTLTVPVIECAEGVDQCFVANIDSSTNHIIRGCNELGTTICADFGCYLCPWDDCNDIQYIEETCISCTSVAENNFCEWNVVDNVSPVLCPDTTLEKSGCFLHIKDNQYTRGCVASLDDEMYQTCASGEECKMCKGDSCNGKDEFQRCYTCDSETDENCVYRPDGSYIQNCQNYDDYCVAFAVANGKTGRGCASEIITEPTFCPGTNCAECTGVECNSGLVPTYRITCYQCNSDQFGCTEDQAMFQSYLRACNTFDFQDQCFSYKDGDNFVRGCMSDNSADSQLCAADPSKCTVCSNSNCNSAPAVPKVAELECYHCSQNDVECALLTSTSLQCQTAAETGQVESCYYSKSQDGTIQMGCTLDDSAFCSSNECVTCTGANCNEEYFPKGSALTCYQCDDAEGCPWRQKEPQEPVTCQSTVFYGDVDSCYYYKYADGEVRRGCTLDDAAFCVDHECKTCIGNYCNAEAETQSCIQCNSTLEQFATCDEDARDLNATPCAQDAYYEEIGCYSLKNDDVVIRGCWNEATAEHVTFCGTEDAECEHCIGEGCNTHDHSGSAALAVTLPLLLLSALAALLIQ